MAAGRPYVVVVFGMSRSGTSAVAGMLHALGVNMGSVFLEPDAGNPKGYWEDLDMLALNVALLRVAGGHWLDPPLGRDIANAHQHLGGQMGRLMRAKVEHAQGQPWGWKDPRNCLTLHAWHNTLARLELDPLFVEVVRDPGQVVWSLIKRGKSSRSWWRQHMRPMDWARLVEEYGARVAWYHEKVEQAAPGWLDDRWVRVSFEDVLERPTAWARHFAELLGLEPSMLELATAAATIQKREENHGEDGSNSASGDGDDCERGGDLGGGGLSAARHGCGQDAGSVDGGEHRIQGGGGRGRHVSAAL